MSKNKNSIMRDPETVGPKSESLIPYEVKNVLADRLREKIKMIESSDGKNTDHPTIEAGMHEGQNAVGSFGLMPKTIKEFSLRMIRDDKAPLVVKRINAMEDEQKAADLVAADPELEELFVENALNHVIKKQKGDMDRSAYAWERGHNLSPDKITNEKLDKSDYVRKFRELGKKIKVYGSND